MRHVDVRRCGHMCLEIYNLLRSRNGGHDSNGNGLPDAAWKLIGPTAKRSHCEH